MSAHRLLPSRRGLAVALIACACWPVAWADDHPRAARTPLLPAYAQECSGCHLAYPPQLLPAASWQRLMANLPRHFGTDASLDPTLTQSLTTWLLANAGNGRRASEAPPDDRITRARWFVREHDEIGAAVWKRPAIKSPANCAACHPRAEQGAFSEHDIRIPR